MADGSTSPRPPEDLLECLLQLLDATPALAMVADREGRLMYLNTNGRRILGIDPSEPLSTLNASDFYSSTARETLFDEAVPASLDKGLWRGELTLVGRDDREIPVAQVLTAHALSRGERKGSTVLSTVAWNLRGHERAEREPPHAESELPHQATHDSMTGLPNRLLLRDRLMQAMRVAERHGHYVAVLFLDLDDFEHVNDCHGHDAGDIVLRTLGRRLAACLRSEDTVARYGGDDFVVLLPNLTGIRQCEGVMRRIERASIQPIDIGGRTVTVSASIGVAICCDDREDADEVIRRAGSRAGSTIHRVMGKRVPVDESRAPIIVAPYLPTAARQIGQ